MTDLKNSAGNALPMLVVSCALVERDGAIIMHRRPPGTHHAGRWEFAGGKVEPGETPAAALTRELAEELSIRIAEQDLMPTGFVASSDAGPEGCGIVLLLYVCRRWTGEPQALNGAATASCQPAAICRLDLAPLDRLLVPQLRLALLG
ncbi:(deoxy)nucleoside triphosphate pyrophosphohydrolase [Croceicoccus sp. F390]|uniref:8-oxo-dGTP diphosphatase n=1 Tax=Croceicoccus esteveae TaxID=3075597 RepID=A0ABU2ZHY5_9SPHN|nr:(deoxy)nucleoside triphosphate pyrophosphohydrolase [Croceicoccus sp. F390]MDT0575204.1 (deoxy)nucleoside triphosphate pyrophosphohydrolase [Croceicoccus sp. F390]